MDTPRIKTCQNVLLAAYIAGGPLALNRNERLEWVPGREMEAQSLLLSAINMLPDKLQAIILLRFGEGLTLNDLGHRVGLSRERIRQLEAKALRVMRRILLLDLPKVRESFQVSYVPASPLDPDWMRLKQASALTELTPDHLRLLIREGAIEGRKDPFDRRYLLIHRAGLRAYVLGGQGIRGRRKGIWKGG